MDISQLELIERYADILQVGARNMQNFTLLRELGHSKTPVMLKRGISATIEEWLLSAEYILSGGNMNVMLCERGIRTFESYTRNTLDISAIPVVQQLSHLPILVDPSHGTGKRDKVASMARAAVAAGCRRPDHRGPLRSGPRVERRRAVDVPGPVRSPDGGAADHRAGDRPQHLPRAGDPAGLVALVRGLTLPFARVGIVGFGLIGGSIARSLRRSRRRPALIGIDAEPVLAAARRARLIDDHATDVAALGDVDLVILAAPVRTNLALLARLAAAIPATAVVTDVGSTKRASSPRRRRCRA